MTLRVVRSKVTPKQSQTIGEDKTTTKEERLPVCIVEQNHLAARYLIELLATNPALHGVTLEDLIAHKPSERIAPVFIIDREGIDLPLSECLHVLRERYRNAKFVILDEQQPTEETVRLLALGVHGFVSYAQLDVAPAIPADFEQGTHVADQAVTNARTRHGICASVGLPKHRDHNNQPTAVLNHAAGEASALEITVLPDSRL